jgi:hypothetical protein
VQNGELRNEVGREQSEKADMKAAIEEQQRIIGDLEAEKCRQAVTIGK